MTVLESALAYVAAGISVVPIKLDGTKRPPVRWKEYQSRIAGERELRDWFGCKNPAGIAAIGGAVSGGLELLDFDTAEVGEQWLALMRAEEPELLSRLTLVRSPRPGLHVWYRVDGMPVPGNQKLAWADEGGEKVCTVETRGEGGYGLVPGSPPSAHLTGRTYDHIAGPGFDALAVVSSAERDAMHQLARVLDRSPAEEVPQPAPAPSAGGRPGDEYEDRGESWASLLERHGWSRIGGGDGYEVWRRPGKGHGGHSATLGYCKDRQGRPLLRVFSSNASPFEDGRTYTKFGALAVLEYRGDYAGATRALTADGFGQPAQAKKKPKSAPRNEQDRGQPDESDAPDPINKIDLRAEWPKLGKKGRHGILGDIVGMIAPETESDPVGILLQLLAACGSALGRRPFVQIEGDRHHANLFVCVVGKTAAARKGTSLGRMRQVMDLAAPEWSKDNVRIGLHSGEGLIYHVRDRRARTKEDGTEEVLDDGSDVRNILAIEAEFATVLRRMSKQGNTLSGILRQAWDCATLASLTKASPDRASEAMVSVIGHITDEELDKCLENVELQNGFGNRFLWACVERKNILPFGGSELRGLPRLAGLLGQAIKDGQWFERIDWTLDARELWEDKYEGLTAGRPGLLGAVTSRAASQVLRIALIFAVLDGRLDIGRDHLEAALAVWGYCDQSAQRIFGSRAADPEAAQREEDAEDLLGKILAAGTAGMTRSEMYSAYNRHKSAAVIIQAISDLRDRDAIRSTKTPTGGRTSERWFAAKEATKANEDLEREKDPSCATSCATSCADESDQKHREIKHPGTSCASFSSFASGQQVTSDSAAQEGANEVAQEGSGEEEFDL